MTTLTIIPNWKNKTARFKGTIAAGEHVAVSIANDDGYITDTTNLRLRVVHPANGKTLAQFPMPETADDETDGENEILPSSEAPAEGEVDWASDTTPLFCILNLNTDRMLMAVPPAANVPLLFVLDDYEGKTLYFKDYCEVTHWPRRVGEEDPTNLDDYKDLIEDFRERIDAAEDSIRDAVDEANGIVAHVDAAKTDAQNSATAAGNSASNAQTSAATAKNWATGGGETGDPGATNNAKYFAQQAGASATSAGNSATSASGSASAAANSATAAEQWATGGTGGTPSATNNAKYYAEQAEETLDSKADANDLSDEVTRATAAESALANNLAGAFTAATYNSTTKKIVFTKQDGTTADIDATDFIKDGMVSSVVISGGNLVITFNSDAGKQPISIPLTQIFNPSNYYDKTAADDRFVQKETGKGLSTNDYTTEEKGKLAGIESGAKNNVLEYANLAAFPATGEANKIYVAKDTNNTYRWETNAYVQIGGGGGSGGTTDYANLTNKPTINAVTLSGNKTAADLGLATAAQGAKADTAYQKPQTGIPASDMTQAVQDIISLFGTVSGNPSNIRFLIDNGDGVAFGVDEAEGTPVFVYLKNNQYRTMVLPFKDGTLALRSDIPSVAGLAPLSSPAFTGTPTAPTPAAADNSTKVATTAFVKTAISGISVTPLSKRTFSFATTQGVMDALKATIEALGGTVVNAPAAPAQNNQIQGE